MKVEIWSDIACPFCYIGKRRFEMAMKRFEHQDEVEVIWHSYQLDPGMKHIPGANIDQVLAEKKGWSPEQAKEMNAHVVKMAKESGLNYDMDKVVPANTFDAHRLTHLAKKHGLQDKAEERLFAAYFIEGKNISDHNVLAGLGKEIGLDEAEVKSMLGSDQYKSEVQEDIEEADLLRIRGVPFFVINRKYGVSGAQPETTFLQALETAYSEIKN